MATTDGTAPEPGPDASIDELQADIAKTRQELGETVSALADKADVKAQVHAKVADTKQAAAERAQVVQETVRRNPGLDAGVVVGLVAVIGLIVWLRRRKR
jgi:F0F1-type ATP synthase assembly protein I